MTSQRKVNFRGNLTSTSTKLALFVAFNAMVVHEVLASLGSAKPLSMRPGTVSLKDWLVDQWGTILRDVNYEPVFDLAVRVLKSIPSHPIIETMLRNLIGIAASIVSSKALLKHDIAGRIYHTLLLKDVAKGLATYYTSIPGAYLLAKLAIKTRDFESFLVGENEPYVIADLACGSGTLLSASYSSVLDTWIQRRLEKGGEISSEEQAEFHKTMLEKILYGFDVLEYAVHLAAAWLTVRMPEVAVREMNVYTLPLGREVDNTWLGSLSIRTDSQDVCTVQMATSLTGEESGAKAGGLVRKMKTPIKMPRPRLVIMNPPFARTGNVGHSILMGHLPDSERKVVLAALREYLNSAKRS